MAVVNLSDLSGDIAVSVPTCVIGGGIAGLLVARRLAKNGHRVVVVESGLGFVDAATQELNRIEDVHGRYTRSLDGRYRALGGTSTRWGGRLIPISRHEFQARPYLSQPGWPFAPEEIDAYQSEIEGIFEVDGSSYENDVLDSVDRLGYFPRWDGDVVSRWAKCPTFRRCNLATTLKSDIDGLPLLDTWLGATVCGFELDPAGGRLVAIEARSLSGHKLSVRADRFVVAAGTIESTRLLLELDASSDGRAFERCRVLGRYFQDHLKVTVARMNRRDVARSNEIFAYRFMGATTRDLRMTLTADAQRDDAIPSAYGLVTMDMEESPLSIIKDIAQGRQRRELDVRLLLKLWSSIPYLTRTAYWRYWRHQLFVPANVQFNLQMWAEQVPERANRIRLANTRDRFGMRKVLLEWSPTAADERTFRHAVARMRRYWTRSGFDQVCPLEWSAASSDPAQSLTASAIACAHPSGSTRMGTDPAESVVNPDLRCHAVPNVSVVSGATFPSPGSANPTLTIMKLALRLADSILHKAEWSASSATPGAEPRPVPQSVAIPA
jgi:choline dehydrogenase-like flavoprotein